MKGIQLVTPPVTVQWAKLYSADRKFAGEGEPGDYSIEMLFDPTKEPHSNFLAALEKIWDSEYEAFRTAEKKKSLVCHDKPWRMQTDRDGNETGMILLRSKQAEWFTGKGGERVPTLVKVFDAKRNVIKTEIGNGSTCRVSFRMAGFYYGAKFGLTTNRLQAVQLLDLVEYSSDFGFDDEDGYTDPDAAAFDTAFSTADTTLADKVKATDAELLF